MNSSLTKSCSFPPLFSQYECLKNYELEGTELKGLTAYTILSYLDNKQIIEIMTKGMICPYGYEVPMNKRTQKANYIVEKYGVHQIQDWVLQMQILFILSMKINSLVILGQHKIFFSTRKEQNINLKEPLDILLKAPQMISCEINGWQKITNLNEVHEILRLSGFREGGNEPMVADLMDYYSDEWDDSINDFSLDDDFDEDHFTARLLKHAHFFKKEEIDYKIHFGFIQKFVLDGNQNIKIYVRADLHGDLKSLIENLKCLKEEGLLDENYKCAPGFHLVFLGDYSDRGSYSTEVLFLLMRLREENPDQIHLIRGNHEYTYLNKMFSGNDNNFETILNSKKGREALERFYETLPLSVYFGVSGEKIEYVQFTHGAFELTQDPVSLLDNGPSGFYIPVDRVRQLSHRINQLVHKRIPTACKIFEAEGNSFLEDELTAYNWADVSYEQESLFGELSNRSYALSADLIKAYLSLSSEMHHVKMIFRGHQHKFQHLKDEEGKVLVTTLPVGADCAAYVKDKNTEFDIAYLLTPEPEVEKWTKEAMFRLKTCSYTTLSDHVPIMSSGL